MNENKTKLILDFDDTVFDTSAFMSEIFSLFRRMGYLDDQIESTYETELLDYKYSPIDQLKRLQEMKKSSDVLAVARFENLFKISYKYIHEDTSDFLIQMKSKGYELILLTLGDPYFQRSKVENSKINSYFSKIYYIEVQKWNCMDKIVDPGEKFIFIDDRSDAVFEVTKKYPNCFALFIDRPNRDSSKKRMDNLESLIKVKSLKHAEKLLI